MERQGYMHGGYCRAWTAQFAQEKQGKAAGDHFIVEELLDFSNEGEGEARMAAGDEGGYEAARGNCSADSSSVTTGDSCANSFPGDSDTRFSDELICPSLAGGGLSGDLCEPFEELAELEWLSNFVEDSFSGEELHKHHLISGIKSPSSEPTHPTPADDPPQLPLALEVSFPVKARSKLVRTAPSNWSSRLLLLAPITASLSPEHSDELVKKQVKKYHSAAADGRKCLHCATDKTPQWRSGPMGPKTLCNACGVRYKSGRLVPEYRPASSPTFELCVHSNSHRKVLELRRQKEIQRRQMQFLPAYGGAVAVPAEAAGGDEILIHQRLRADLRQVF